MLVTACGGMLLGAGLTAGSGQWILAMMPLIVGYLFGLAGAGRPILSWVDADEAGIRFENWREPERFVRWSELEAMELYVDRSFRPFRWWITTTSGERVPFARRRRCWVADSTDSTQCASGSSRVLRVWKWSRRVPFVAGQQSVSGS